MDEWAIDAIEKVFAYIDEQGGPLVIAMAELVLGNNSTMTLQAGGGDLTLSPSTPPFETYQVLLDQEPPRFWRRYTEKDDVYIYSHVPRLLVTHHIVRHGGLSATAVNSMFIKPTPRRKLEYPINTVEELASVLSNIVGRDVDQGTLIW